MNDIITLQYKGFLNTPNLWLDKAVNNFSQFELFAEPYQIINFQNFNELRLGKRVEQFFEFQIKNSPDIEFIANNIQIKNKKLTVGELDAIVLKNKQPIHVEIVYKFYLYDASIKSENELAKWIGPNRKDTLAYKINKLNDKQLPLLYSKYSKDAIHKLDLVIDDIAQQVCYKAQLFLAFRSRNIDVAPLNQKSLCGFYISYSEFRELKNFKFYIPSKLNWLIRPHPNVKWITFAEAKQSILSFISEKRSPMIWLKENDRIQKCFVTFW